jgi:hypothetical protein
MITVLKNFLLPEDIFLILVFYCLVFPEHFLTFYIYSTTITCFDDL